MYIEDASNGQRGKNCWTYSPLFSVWYPVNKVSIQYNTQQYNNIQQQYIHYNNNTHKI